MKVVRNQNGGICVKTLKNGFRRPWRGAFHAYFPDNKNYHKRLSKSQTIQRPCKPYMKDTSRTMPTGQLSVPLWTASTIVVDPYYQ